ncbi:MAG: hypothetical protein B655_1597 [Methanobacterium sp. Maddingley MBC34]|nr:MAG: hypothetical protein B655_1597 [Methanobacterium sp. Maddingley MBC34]
MSKTSNEEFVSIFEKERAKRLNEKAKEDEKEFKDFQELSKRTKENRRFA